MAETNGYFNGRCRNVSEVHPCPICGKPDWCSVSEGGAVALCRRQGDPSQRRLDTNGDTFYLHHLRPATSASEPRYSLKDGGGRLADPDTRHRVYLALLKSLTLFGQHEDALKTRGLKDDLLSTGYRSLPQRGRYRAVRQLIKEGLEEFLPTVPGFFIAEQNGCYWTVSGAAGLLIPVRDCRERIIALLCRPDEQTKGGKYRWLSSKKRGGPGPGAPIHVPLFQGDKSTVRITEGALKADIATRLSGVLTIGLPGVNSTRRVPALLKQIGAKIARVALDADADRNGAVGKALYNLVRLVKEKGFGLELETWDEAKGKGIDDLLAAGHQPTLVEGDKALQVAEGIATLAGVFNNPSAKSLEESASTEGDKESAATRLVKWAKAAGVHLFHTPEQVAYAIVPCDKHKETWPLKSTGFRRWLSRLFYQAEEKTAPSEAVSAALATLEGFALFDGDEELVHVRLAGDLNKIYLDLADEAWRCIEMDANGWRIVDEAPVRFIRPRGLLALPEPERGGKLDELRPFANVKHDDGWRLLLGFLFGTLHPIGPYPLLAQVGEQGSAKTTLGRLIRSIIDPNKAPLRRKPRDERDLAIAASNGWLVAFDNLSDLPDWLSDALCCISTGGGFGTRELYTDDEEKLFAYKRPQLLTSIEDVVTRGDLLDRTLFLELEAIPKQHRRTEASIYGRFEKVRARILGALLTAISGGLCNLPNTRLDELPRMADFALWAEACGRSIGWQLGDFVAAYERNRAEVNDQALDVSPVTPILRAALAGQEDGAWQGTARELHDWLNGHAEEKIRAAKSWPASPRAMGNMIRRLAPNLRRAGFTVIFERDKTAKRTRIIYLKIPPNDTDGPPPEGSDDPTPERDRNPPSKTSKTSQDGESGGVNTIPEGPCVDGPLGWTEMGESSSDRPECVQGSSNGSTLEALDDPATNPGRTAEQEPSDRKSLRGEDLNTTLDVSDVLDSEMRPLSHSLSDDAAYQYFRSSVDLQTVHQALDESDRIALDRETTGLDPRKDRIRLLQLATERGLYLLDCFTVDPRPLFELSFDRRARSA